MNQSLSIYTNIIHAKISNEFLKQRKMNNILILDLATYKVLINTTLENIK